jgi:HEXXH motif-containing protein
LEQSCPGIVGLLEEWRDSEITFDSVWDTSLGNIRRALMQRIDPITSAASFALHLCSNGVPATWRVRFEEPKRLKWGNLLFSPSVEACISGGGDSFSLDLVDVSARHLDVHLWRSEHGWQATHSEQLARWMLEQHEISLVFGNTSDCLDLLKPDGELSPLPLDEILRTCRETVALMRCYAPSYLRWIDKVLRQVIPIKGGDNRLLSCSSYDYPGTIEVSFPSEYIAVAEMLIHEASHQYFNIVRRFEEVHDGSDKRLYHSPVKEESRPIDAILLAFHAFANVVLFYRQCIAAGLEDDGYCKKNAARHLAELNIMHSHLQSSDALTKVGVLLWKPLAAELFSKTS